MASKNFKPTLGKIIEEPCRQSYVDLNDDILEEYEVLSEDDLIQALHLNPKAFKKGQYLSELKYRTKEEDSEEEDNDDDDCNIDVTDNYSDLSNPKLSQNERRSFEELHFGAAKKNRMLIGRLSSNRSELASHSSLVSDTDSVGTSESIRSGRRQRNHHHRLSGSSYSSLKNGEQLLHQALDHHPSYQFDSKHGKKIFVKSILKKYMSIYYVISPPQVTTTEIESSGVSTICALRNALKVKDGNNGQLQDGTAGIHEEEETASLVTSYVMFDGASRNLNFDEFVCVARLNNLSMESVFITNQSDIKLFRNDVKLCCQSDTKVCVCYYSCHELYQSAGFYFALIGGYFKEKDLVLLFDASRHKIPPFWISLTVLWKAIQSRTADEYTLTETKLGYFLVENGDMNPYIILNVNKKVSISLSPQMENYERLIQIQEQWERWLLSPKELEIDILQEGFHEIINIITSQTIKPVEVKDDEAATVLYKKGSLLDMLTRTKTFSVIEKFVSSLDKENLAKLSVFSEWLVKVIFVARKKVKTKQTGRKRKKKVIKRRRNQNTFNNTAALTTWVLFWPYEWQNSDSNCSVLAQQIIGDLSTFSSDILSCFHEQINFVTKILHTSTSNVYKYKV